MKTPEGREFRDFLAIDGWVLERETDHDHFIKPAPPDVLRTHVSFGSSGVSPGLWAFILRTQLKVANEQFWEALRTGKPATRPAPNLPPTPPTKPAYIVRVLQHDLHLTDDQITALSLEEAVRLPTPVSSSAPHVKRALITGITGQDGSYLCELLLAEGYAVAGLFDDPDAPPPSGMPVPAQVERLIGDLRDAETLRVAVEQFRPDEIYNLAAMSFVGQSFEAPIISCDVTGMGVLRLLEAIRQTNPAIRLFQASSAEMFGHATTSPQSESTPCQPRSPYGVAKLFAHQMVAAYRTSYAVYACSGILFNHESPRRGIQFVTRKISDGVARIKHGLQSELALGNLDAARDWGFAGDYVRAMHLMLQQDEPGDYVIASGETHQLRDFLDIAFSRAGLSWQDHVVTDPRFTRPSDIATMTGDISRARRQLGWEPTTSFRDLVEMMVDADLAQVASEVGSAL